MKITAVMGSPHKGQTYRVVKTFEDKLKAYLEVDFKYLFLNEVNLKLCRGCGVCLERGEEYCPLDDDLKGAAKILLESDGVIFAAPVYSLQVPAQMKIPAGPDGLCVPPPLFFPQNLYPDCDSGSIWRQRGPQIPGICSVFWGFQVLPGSRADYTS